MTKLSEFSDRDLQDELVRRESERKWKESLPKDERLAMELHGLMCNSNHTDGCGWFYEIENKKDNWESPSHKYWIGKARRALKIEDNEEKILKIVKAVR